MLAVPLVQVSWDSIAWQACYLYTHGLSPRSALSSERDPSVETSESVSWKQFVSPLELQRKESMKLFQKQQIPSYQVKKRLGWMSCGTCSACVLLSCLSLVGFYNSSRPMFVGIEYHSVPGPASENWLPTLSAAFASSTLTRCHDERACTITIPSGMKSPISIYFSIGPFYENYLDYVKTSDYVNNSFASNIAYRSFFNDTFKLKGVHMIEDNIAWPTDLAFVDGLEESGVSSLFASPEIAKQHMAVWMRPCAFSECLKLYGKVEQDISQNNTLTVVIYNRYPAADFHKRIWITDWQADGAGTFWANWLLAGSILALLATLLLACIWYLETDGFFQGSRADTSYYNRLPLPP